MSFECKKGLSGTGQQHFLWSCERGFLDLYEYQKLLDEANSKLSLATEIGLTAATFANGESI